MPRWRLRMVWAMLLGVVVMVGAWRYLSSQKPSEAVVVAVREIEPRTEITPDLLLVVMVSPADKQALAPGAFESTSQVVGRFARRRIQAREIMRDNPADFTKAGEVPIAPVHGQGALAAFLPADARAVTVKADRQAVVGQHLRAGDRVDVTFTSKSDGTGGVYASLLLQQIVVMDVQAPAADSPDGDVLVTLLVTPAQAVDVNLAKRIGVIDLALVPPDAGAPVPPRITSPLLFAGQAAALPGKAGVVQSPPAQESPKPGKP